MEATLQDKLFDISMMNIAAETSKSGVIQGKTYKYSTLKDIQAVLTPILKEFDIQYRFIMNMESTDHINIMIKVRSGEEDVNYSAKLERIESQGQNILMNFGTAETYFMKYLLRTTFNVNTNEDDDSEDVKQTKKSFLKEGSEEFVAAVYHLKSGGDIKDIKAKFNLQANVEKALLTGAI